MSTKDAWSRFPVRCCYFLHELYGKKPDSCRICGKRISVMDRYFDGGRGRRAHVDCVERADAEARRGT